MKNYKRIITKSLPAIAAVLICGCAGVDMKKLAKDQKLTVTPNPLELHGDSVKFDINAVVPVKMLKKNKVYTVAVAYKAFDNRLELGKVIFNGNDFPNASTTPPTLSKRFSFAYADNLKKGDLLVNGEMAALGKEGKGKKTLDLPVAKGVITTPLLVKDVYPVAYADHGYDNREELTPTVVQFYYKKGISKLETTERSGKRAKFFEKFIASKYVTRTVNIIGTHSPEGAETVNEKLSEERAITIEKWYRETMKKYNYKGKADSITFVIKGKVKDWSDFKAKLDSNKRLTDEQKTEILAVVDGADGSFRQKEAQLQSLKSYKILLKDIYPSLRNANTEVLTVKIKKSDAQIYLLAKKLAGSDSTISPPAAPTKEAPYTKAKVSKGNMKADTLDSKELLYAATLTPDPNEKQAILLAATKRDASYEAHNNLGALYLEKAKKELNAASKTQIADQAISQLEIAKNKKEGAEVYLNLATAKLLKGDKAGAAEASAKAMTLQGNAEVTKGLKGIQGVLDIKSGNYDAAVSNLSSAGTDGEVTFNRGLALLLKKDNATAKSTIDEAIAADGNQATYFYASAIASARQNDVDNMSAALKKAFTLNGDLKAKALDDLEFVNMIMNEKFKDALK